MSFEVYFLEGAEKTAVSACMAVYVGGKGLHEGLEEAYGYMAGVEVDVERLAHWEYFAGNAAFVALQAGDVGVEGERFVVVVPECLDVGVAYGAAVVAYAVDV